MKHRPNYPTTGNRLKDWLIVVGVLLLFMLTGVEPAFSQEIQTQEVAVLDIDVPDTVVCNSALPQCREGGKDDGRTPAGWRIISGTQLQLAVKSVPAAWVGATCMAVVVGSNGPSVHPGTTFHIVSQNTVSAPGVESAPGITVEARGDLILSSSVAIVVELGSDLIFSGNGEVVISCTQTTTSSTTTTTTTPPTVTTTTTPTDSTTSTTTPTGTSTSTTIGPVGTTLPPDGGTLPWTGPYPTQTGTPGDWAAIAIASILLASLILYVARHIEDSITKESTIEGSTQ